MKTQTETAMLRPSGGRLERERPTLRTWIYWWGGYLLYTLYHVVGLPIVLIRFVGRMRSGRYRGVIGSRFGGGSKPPSRGDWTLIVASGLGETRTAVHAADEIGGKVAVLTQLAKMPAALRHADADFPVGFAPFNSPISAIACLFRWRPRAILFVEFSGNYHLAFWARMMGVRTALINVNLPEVRLRRYQRKALGAWQFSFVDAFCVQAHTHAERLQRLGVQPTRIFEAGISLGLNQGSFVTSDAIRDKWRALLQLKAETPVLVAGSTYHDEELQLLEAVDRIRVRHPSLVLILAPRHLERPGTGASALNERCVDFDRRTMLDRHERAANTILLDSVGELREIYSVATLAFVGGSLITSVGGHTPLEAFAWGVPTTVGPHFGQQEAPVYFCEQTGLLQICASQEALIAAWCELLEDPDRREAMRLTAAEHLLNVPHAFAEGHAALLAMT